MTNFSSLTVCSLCRWSDCALEQIVKYGETYYIHLSSIKGPITLEFRYGHQSESVPKLESFSLQIVWMFWLKQEQCDEKILEMVKNKSKHAIKSRKGNTKQKSRDNRWVGDKSQRAVYTEDWSHIRKQVGTSRETLSKSTEDIQRKTVTKNKPERHTWQREGTTRNT